MDYMFKEGFLHTHAPLFMDEVTVVVAFLPLLVAYAIKLAKDKKYKAHAILQTIIYIVGLIVVSYFEYGARVMGGFAVFMKNSSMNLNFMYAFLAFHVFIAIMSTLIWSYTVFHGIKNYENMMSREFRKRHLKIAKPAFIGVVLTSLTGVMLYMFLFVF